MSMILVRCRICCPNGVREQSEDAPCPVLRNCYAGDISRFLILPEKRTYLQVPDTNPVWIGSNPVFLPVRNRSAVTILKVNERMISIPNFQNGYIGLIIPE